MMKNKKSAKFFISFIVIMISITVICSSGASAHEIYYDGSTGINLKWFDVTSRVAYLKMNGDKLNSNYSSHYTIARNAWHNASARVTVKQTSFSSSNVDLATATESAWENMWGWWDKYSYLGICQASSTDGVSLTSLANAKASSKRIKYAGILLTPYQEYSNDTHRRGTMVHEIGHALGLGHPNTGNNNTSAASIMRQSTVETYYLPQTHDTNDLNAKY